MNFKTFTAGTLVEEVLQNLYRVTEYPRSVVLGSDALANTTDPDFTLSIAEDWEAVSLRDVVEFETELVEIVAKTDVATPLFTSRRGFGGSTAAVHAAGTVGLLNPQFPRQRVLRAVERAVYRLDAWVPKIVTDNYSRVPGKPIVLLPATTVNVVRVLKSQTQGSLCELGGWNFYDNMPLSGYATGRALEIHGLQDSDTIIVTTTQPYSWSQSPVTEASTISLPYGSEGVVISYTSAYLPGRREIGRFELDNVDEISKIDVSRSGVPNSVIRDLWQQFYREVDEARRLHNTPTARPYRTMKSATRNTYVRRPF